MGRQRTYEPVGSPSVATILDDTRTTRAQRTAGLVGHHYRVTDFYEVGREKIREFAESLQDPHPAYRSEDAAVGLGYDGLIAPLTFGSIVAMIAQQHLFGEVLTGYDPAEILHTDQRLQFHRPIAVGDRLICDVFLDSFRHAAGNDIMVTKTIMLDQHDTPVQTMWTTLVAYSR
ncbi:MaoC family dehydratase N-terminal domain-containing protein (plasmid) [Rhodococcus sp. 21391]|nr:MaoC family dehydratase N-terminal domain-containing protein [Rhodococcus sp. 21391]